MIDPYVNDKYNVLNDEVLPDHEEEKEVKKKQKKIGVFMSDEDFKAQYNP